MKRIHNKRIFGIRLSYIIAIILAIIVIAVVVYSRNSSPETVHTDCAALKISFCDEWKNKSWLIPPVDTRWKDECGIEPVEEECRDLIKD